MELAAGSVLGTYRIAGALGRGGMAAVYKAYDPALDRHVALKVLPSEFLHDPAFAERFRQEARVAARLEHPQIVPIHGYGIDDGRPWMAMRLVTGGALSERLRRGPLAATEAARVLRDVAGALDYAHAHGVVHRDVKPANVLLDESGRAYLADFGIAKMLEGSSLTTASGFVQGTPSYMAPEQAMGTKVDRLADVYALGVVAFECLTGRVPYTGTTPVAVLMKHVQEPVPEPAASELARPLTDVLRRCLAKAPAERWASAGAFADALAQAAHGAPTADLEPPTLELSPPPSARPRRALVAGACLAALVLIAGSAWHALRRGAPAASEPPPAPAAAPTASATAGPARTAPASPRSSPTPEARTRPLPDGPPAPVSSTVAPPTVASPTVASPTVVPAPARARSEKIRVYCEAKLEPVLFRKTRDRDVNDSLEDLLEAIRKRGVLDVVDRREDADAVVQVLERGRDPALIGMRKVRVRVLVGRDSVELTGQDSFKGFNTWSGAANGAADRVETWLQARLPTRGESGAGS